MCLRLSFCLIAKMQDSEDDSYFNEYYPGEIVYRDFEAGDVKTKTQMDFVKMLIGIMELKSS